MTTILQRTSLRAARLWKDRGILVKAMSFAVIGVINALIDASVFFLSYAALGSFTVFVGILGQIAGLCGCGGFHLPDNLWP